MIAIKTHGLKLATAGVLAISALSGLLAPTSASAALVSGDATITIDNTAFSAATSGFIIERFYDESYNTTPASSLNTSIGTSNTNNMSFPVNDNPSNISYAGNRSKQATTMDAGNTAAGQIGLSGAFRMTSSIFGTLQPYDFTLQKFSGVWNLVTHDTSFGATTFLQLTNVSESVNGSGQLLLDGDLIFGGGIGPTTSPSPFFLTWSSFLTNSGATVSPNAVVGHLSLAPPAAVPLPGAVWLFGSAVLGLIGVNRRKVSALSA
ncbi:MAG: hypothetical protein BVN35_13985 [Proteobacteria bacterium ST_bin11]|nr:MAG: hypothetical protein BVN35_13985 [Proteobacteria bacterium ST_bin11]